MPTTRQRRHDAAREEIMAVARGVMSEDGYAAFSLREVARRSGFAVASLYTYFPGKGALVEALAEESLVELEERLRRAGRDEAVTDRLVALGLAYIEFVRDDPAALACMSAASGAAGASLREAVVRRFSAAFDPVVTPGGSASPTTEPVQGERSSAGGPGQPSAPAVALWALAHGLIGLGLDRAARGQATVDARIVLEAFAVAFAPRD